MTFSVFVLQPAAEDVADAHPVDDAPESLGVTGLAIQANGAMATSGTPAAGHPWPRLSDSLACSVVCPADCSVHTVTNHNHLRLCMCCLSAANMMYVIRAHTQPP